MGILIPAGFNIEDGQLGNSEVPLFPNYRIGWRMEREESRGFFRAGISSATFIFFDPLYVPFMPYFGGGIRF